MTIEAFILCFNESVMIEHTLNYYTKFCNKVTVIDNQSTDDSVMIIKRKFPRVIIEQLDTNGQFCETSLINIRNNIWKSSKADYVIVADMDEFIVSPNISATLEEMMLKNIAVPKVIGYNMYSRTFPDDYNTSILNQATIKLRSSLYDKNIIFSPRLIKEMNFGPGSHYCKPEYKKGVNQQSNEYVEIDLLHFKYLSREYLYDKHKAYASRSSKENRKYNYGVHYLLGNKHIDSCFDRIESKLKSKEFKQSDLF